MASKKEIGLDELPGFLFRRLHQLATARFAVKMENIALTPIQWAALMTISRRPGHDQSTLSREIFIDTSTIAGVLDRIEARGLIQRKPSPADRRLRLLYPTSEGESLLNDATVEVLEMQAWLLEPLSAEERTAFMGLMLKLLHRRE